MKFSRYFDLWLNQNYYKNGVAIGKKGDFYTSVSVGSFFGICIAKYIIDMAVNFKSTISLVEIGSNEGYLLADIVQGIFTFSPQMFEKFEFIIIEPHEILRQKQKTTFKKRFGNDVLISHYKSLDECKFENAIFVSNELFDCFACEVINNNNMLFVENNQMVFKKCDDEILNFAGKFGVKKGEISIYQTEFIKKVVKSANKFIFITFDYGQTSAKNDFSLRVYKAHNVYNFFEISNLNDFFGNGDLTYDVNFDVLKRTFEEEECKVEISTQAKALVNFGGIDILDFILKKSGENAYKNAMYQFKRLISPMEFGEKFKMFKAIKGML